MTTLFTPARAGALTLQNRMVMTALTRRRAEDDGTPTELQKRYYSQRASAGMIVTEGTFPTVDSRGYENQPGIADSDQAAGWASIFEQIHQQGGTVVMQLMHAGRVSHPELTEGVTPIAPSALAVGGTTHVPSGKAEMPVPRAMTPEDITRVKKEFVAAARRAIDAGADGVELHGAAGYLLHQFLAPDSNTRTDEYGGSPENRARFVVELLDDVAAEVGADRVGLRISPQFPIQGLTETDDAQARQTYLTVVRAAHELGIAYLSVMHNDIDHSLIQDLRATFGGFFILNSGFLAVTDRATAERIVEQNLADAVGLGRLYIANPDLPRRFAENLPLNEPDGTTFYVGGERGYIDYPFAP
ncbi:alkene reductase [Rothia dentocariosa]